MTQAEQRMERHSRQMLLDVIGGVGQARLEQARVLLVGAGGLGAGVCGFAAGRGLGGTPFAERPAASAPGPGWRPIASTSTFSFWSRARRKSVGGLRPSVAK